MATTGSPTPLVPIARSRGLALPALAVGVLGAIVCVIAFVVDRHHAAYSYLAAYAYVFSIVLGALVLLMTFHAMHAAWPTLVRRLVESIAGTVPLLALGFIPILANLKVLYPWADPARVTNPHEHEVLLHRAPYLNGPFVVGRAIFYFALWSIVALVLRRWSLQQDAFATAAEAERAQVAQRKLSAVLLPAVGLTLSFASFDWLMALSPSWYSSMFGFYFFAGGFLGAIALTTILVFRSQHAGLLVGANASHYYALGRVLLAFTIFWAYTAYFQLMLIWIADKPIEVRWYVDRFRAGWGLLGLALVVLHFALPFLALLNYHLKRRAAPLALVALWLVAVHYLDIYWIVMPAAFPRGFHFSWMDLGALACTIGFTVAFGAWQQDGHAIAAVRDPDYPRALRYESL